MADSSDSSEASAVVIGRWTGTRRIQVRLEDGRYEVVESSEARFGLKAATITPEGADDVEPGDAVVISLDSEGRAFDWRPAAQ